MSDKFFAVSRTYSLTAIHINKVFEMALRDGKSQGEIVREAIDLLYSKKMPINELIVCDRHPIKKIKLRKFQKQ